MPYCIRDGYKARTNYVQWDDRRYTDQWQRKVYEYAVTMVQANALKSVVDVGCGSGYKLMHYFGHLKTAGVEVEPNYTYCKTIYPHREWVLGDLHTLPSFLPDLLICADVIEHFVNPDQLMEYFKLMAAKYMVVSTPNRDSVAKYNVYPNGPPSNVHHIREWNRPEFAEYVSQHFVVREQTQFDDTQVIVAVSKGE